jgi:hypothetical protein
MCIYAHCFPRIIYNVPEPETKIYLPYCGLPVPIFLKEKAYSLRAQDLASIILQAAMGYVVAGK